MSNYLVLNIKLMNRLLYEKSVSTQGYLIIPFIRGMVDKQIIYSYNSLSELGHKGKFHKVENPAEICSGSLEGIIAVAQEYLDKNSDIVARDDYFKCRYTYRHNLIIVHQQAGKFFYDHYPPEQLNNIAAPKIFASENECINWIKQRLDN